MPTRTLSHLEILATLTLVRSYQSFLEHCTEHAVPPDGDQLRSWLVEQLISESDLERAFNIQSLR